MKILSKTTLLGMFLIVALFVAGLFFYQWQQIRGELIKQTEQVENLLGRINKLQAEIKELKSSQDTTQDETADWKTYESEKYGYELKYPSNYTLTQRNSGDIYLLLEDNIEIWTYSKSDIIDKWTGISDMSFKDFAVHMIKLGCEADGKMTRTYCELVKENSFTTKDNTQGYEIYIKEISAFQEDIIKSGQEKILSEEIKGPIFVLDIFQQTNSLARGLFFEISILNNQKEEELLKVFKQIVSSFKFIN